MEGPSIDPGTGYIYPEFLPPGYGGSSNSDAILVEAQANAVDALNNYIARYDNAAPGSRFDIDCSAGQPLRASLFVGSERTDVFFDYKMVAEPSQATGYAIDDDGWIPI
jgi:hypothetical protein